MAIPGARLTIVLLLLAAQPSLSAWGQSDAAHFVEAFPQPAAPHEQAAGETLHQAWAIALAQDQFLEAKRWSAAAATQRQRAAQSGYLPSLDLDGAYTMRDGQPSFIFQAPGAPLATFPNSQRDILAFEALVTWPLYTGGKVTNAVGETAERLRAAELETRIREQEVKLQVAAEYLAVLRSRRELELAEGNLRFAEAHLKDVESRIDCGRAARLELLSATASVSHARHGLLQSRHRLDLAKAAYNRRLGRRFEDEAALLDLGLEPLDPDLEQWTQRALAQRGELSQLDAQASALRHQAKCLLSENRPQVDLRGGYSYLENRYQTPQGISSVGVGLHWSAYDGGKARRQAEAARLEAESLQRLHADLESTIRLQVRQAWLEAHETRERLRLTGDRIAEAEEFCQVRQERYRTGAGTSTEILEGEALRLQMYRDHASAFYDAVFAMLRLRRTSGEL